MSKSKLPPTLRSIAQELNIHVSTVSRVLNGSEEDARSAASPDTIRRIKELARLRDYRPNLQATSLRTRKTHTITAFLPSISDIVGALIYEGIHEAARERGYVTFMSHTGDDLQHETEQLANAIARKVDGLIFADARPECRHLIEHVVRRGIPTVLVSRHLGEQFCSVTCDDILGGRLAAEHLLSLGHTRLAVVAGFEYASTGADRAKGFVDHCRAQGVEVRRDWIFHSSFDSMAGRRIGEALFSQRSIPTAVFAVNDFLAIGIMGAAREAGLRIGHDIAIVGFNDTPLAANLPISLTSIHSPMHEMGYKGMEVLHRIMGGEKPASIHLPPRLIVRQSSLPASGQTPLAG